MGIPGQSSFREVDLGWPEREPWSPGGLWRCSSDQLPELRHGRTICNVTKGLYLGQPMKRDVVVVFQQHVADRAATTARTLPPRSPPTATMGSSTRRWRPALQCPSSRWRPRASGSRRAPPTSASAARRAASELVADAGGYCSSQSTPPRASRPRAPRCPCRRTALTVAGHLVCSLSQAAVSLAARGLVDATTLSLRRTIHVLNVDTRAWVKVGLGELSPAGAGRSWRLVAPYLSNTDA